jgi:hypothetical protein
MIANLFRYLRQIEQLPSANNRQDEISLRHSNDPELAENRLVYSPREDPPIAYEPQDRLTSPEGRTPSGQTSRLSTDQDITQVDSTISNPLASATSTYLADSSHRLRKFQTVCFSQT